MIPHMTWLVSTTCTKELSSLWQALWDVDATCIQEKHFCWCGFCSWLAWQECFARHQSPTHSMLRTNTMESYSRINAILYAKRMFLTRHFLWPTGIPGWAWNWVMESSTEQQCRLKRVFMNVVRFLPHKMWAKTIGSIKQCCCWPCLVMIRVVLLLGRPHAE